VTPGQGNSYYQQQNFGNQPYFQTQRSPVQFQQVQYPQYAAPQNVYYRPQYRAPQRVVMTCQAPWTC